ncbi:NAD(P)/FAD-dependent oxidoreductase [Halococcus thailandensis]|uniref:FAD-dependent pyridine nucleotide-disulfide oxidoreductase n=1 Tax=Halococcus thailandensis JCM 13552 TaxID=1227457 RepID=M0NCR6_9EURY|nr:NAD(P)/FAD-dependent oxidoreductase [Halococcus thailandensis]EMA55772.1 FAD-dependent pyridine nucleotide-disulfide oxidoreductase [Halococcus thailandensis JCM 13552]
MTNDQEEIGDEYDVIIVGAGVAGLSASIYIARNDLKTLVIDAGDSIMRRNAHLENYPGFPAGINARLLLEMMHDQADRAGCNWRRTEATAIASMSDGFVVETAAEGRYHTEYVIAATKNTTDYLTNVDGVGTIDRGKAYIDTDERGRTGVEGLYAAGRLAEKPHQAIVSAGHGAEVAVTLLEDDDRPFYHDWVTPDGYFTDRGRGLPPGCEEIGEQERHNRENESRETMRGYVAEPHPDEQRTHPSLRDD